MLAVFLDHVLETQGALRGFDPTPVAWYLGRMGVLLFFVLTSLVLLQSLERSALAGRSDALAFYLRRACRIYPLAVACVVAVVAFRIPATAWAERYDAPSIATLASNLALTMNLTYSPRVLSVLWTLPLELQMYLFLPAIHVLLRPAAGVRNALWILAAGVAAAIVVPELVGRLSVAAWAPCFLAGAVCWVLYRTARPRLPFVALPSGLALAMAAYAAIAWAVGEVHPRWLGWLLCLATALLLPHVEEPRSGWLRAACREIARYSYGLYLFHMIALWVGFRVLGDHPAAVQWGAMLALAAALPVLGHHAIEQPGIRLGRRLAARVAARRRRGRDTRDGLAS